VALLLRKKGIRHIRPLQGGLDAWRERGYPMDTVTITTANGATVNITTK
jgi:3-mercaptopyruvate sulfurtransferase SseA